MSDLFVDTYSENYRHECELRYVANMALTERRKYLALIEQNRGLQAKLKLQEGLEIIWKNKKSKNQ